MIAQHSDLTYNCSCIDHINIKIKQKCLNTLVTPNQLKYFKYISNTNDIFHFLKKYSFMFF